MPDSEATGMSDLLPVSIDEAIGEMKREGEMRRQVYTRATREGRMNRRRADRRIEIVDAVVRLLERLKQEGLADVQ
jgi:hypothetical protein